MATDSDWMASNLPGQRAMMANISAKIGNYMVELDLDSGDKDAIVLLCNEFVIAYDHIENVEASAKASVEWRNILFKGTPVGDPAPAAPGFSAASLPAGSTIGILQQIREWRARWVAAPGYTQAIGEDLMIVKVDSEGIAPELAQATIKVFPAQTNYEFAIVVSNRGAADTWVVETQVVGSGVWVNSGTFTGKSANVNITPPESATPLQVQVRVQLRKNNANYGQLSQIATVTVNP